MAQLDNAKPERNIEAGTLEVFQKQQKNNNSFSREIRGQRRRWRGANDAHIVHTSTIQKQNKELRRNIGRKWREILQGDAEKYLTEVERNITRSCREIS